MLSESENQQKIQNVAMIVRVKSLEIPEYNQVGCCAHALLPAVDSFLNKT